MIGDDVGGHGFVLVAVVAGVARASYPVVDGEVAAERRLELGVDRLVEGDVPTGPRRPPALRDENPLGIPRRVDGALQLP